jgi:hypothetical protein
VRVEPEAVERRGAAWRVLWRIRNDGASPLTIREAWHPHGRFRSSRLRRSLTVAARGAASLEVPARVDARPGERIETCFLILRAVAADGPYRILARLTVVLDDDGVPRPRVEAVDVHPA